MSMQATVVPKRPQRPKSVSRDVAADAPGTNIHEWAQASGRMLVATFFIASAVSNMGNSHFDFSAIAIAESSIVLNAMIYSMAFAVLVGRYLHITALILALAMLWSSSLQLTSGQQELASYWQDLAVIGALFYMAASKSGAVAQKLPKAWARGKPVTPRRVLPEGRVMVDSIAGPAPQLSRNHVARPVAMPVFSSRRPSR